MLLAWTGAGCKNEKSQAPASAAASVRVVASVPVPVEHAEPPEHVMHPPPPPPPPEVRAEKLSPDGKLRAVSVRVMTHDKAVIIRKQGGSWHTGGSSSCAVPAERMERALNDLVELETKRVQVEPSTEGYITRIAVETPKGLAFRFDLHERSARGDLIRLGDGTTAFTRGLNRSLWTADASDWCGVGARTK